MNILDKIMTGVKKVVTYPSNLYKENKAEYEAQHLAPASAKFTPELEAMADALNIDSRILEKALRDGASPALNAVYEYIADQHAMRDLDRKESDVVRISLARMAMSRVSNFDINDSGTEMTVAYEDNEGNQYYSAVHIKMGERVAHKQIIDNGLTPYREIELEHPIVMDKYEIGTSIVACKNGSVEYCRNANPNANNRFIEWKGGKVEAENSENIAGVLLRAEYINQIGERSVAIEYDSAVMDNCADYVGDVASLASYVEENNASVDYVGFFDNGLDNIYVDSYKGPVIDHQENYGEYDRYVLMDACKRLSPEDSRYFSTTELGIPATLLDKAVAYGMVVRNKENEPEHTN